MRVELGPVRPVDLVFTNDVNLAFRSIRDFDSGPGYVNHGTIGAEAHLPFGGTKATGNGHREVGQTALDFYTEWKSVYIDYPGKLQRAQIDMEFVDQDLSNYVEVDGDGWRFQPRVAAVCVWQDLYVQQGALDGAFWVLPGGRLAAAGADRGCPGSDDAPGRSAMR